MKQSINWFHTFDFPELKTKGTDNTPKKFKCIEMPDCLTGKTVLDIGTWDGYFAFMAEKRGAKVVAIDSFEWQKEFEITHPELISTFPDPERKGFEYAKKILNSKVEFRNIKLEQLEQLEQFDVVLCLGILYHTKDPWKIINHLGKITKEMLILETHTDGNSFSDLINVPITVPLMVYYPNGWENDFSTYWGMNIVCLAEMLAYAGFKKIEILNFGKNRVYLHAFK